MIGEQESVFMNSDNFKSAFENAMELHPEIINEFQKIQREQLELFCKKMVDYGPSNIAAGTMLKNEKEKLFSLSGIWFRVGDKYNRLRNLIMNNKGGNGQVKDESMEDTWTDLSNYSIIAMIVNRGKWKI